MKLKKYLVNESDEGVKEIDFTNAKDAYNKIKKDCSKYLSLLGNNIPFFRGVRYTLYSSNSYLKIKARKDRRSYVNTRRVFTPFIEKLFNEHNIPLRSKSVNVTSDISHARFFSNNVYYFLPIGNFNYAYCKSNDYNMSKGKYDINGLFRYLSGLVDWVDDEIAWSFIKDGIVVNDGLKVAHSKRFEVWFECDSYYAVKLGDELGELFEK
jgi:hypothetical protein